MGQVDSTDVPSQCARCGVVTLHRKALDGSYHCMKCVLAASTPALAQQVAPNAEQLSRCAQCETTTLHAFFNGKLVCKRCLEKGALDGHAKHHLVMQKVGYWIFVVLTIVFVLFGITYCGDACGTNRHTDDSTR